MEWHQCCFTTWRGEKQESLYFTPVIRKIWTPIHIKPFHVYTLTSSSTGFSLIKAFDSLSLHLNASFLPLWWFMCPWKGWKSIQSPLRWFLRGWQWRLLECEPLLTAEIHSSYRDFLELHLLKNIFQQPPSPFHYWPGSSLTSGLAGNLHIWFYSAELSKGCCLGQFLWSLMDSFWRF